MAGITQGSETTTTIQKVTLRIYNGSSWVELAPKTDWDNISNKPTTFNPSSHTHTKANITDFPTSMPASDVYEWAKASTKPSYSFSEIASRGEAYLTWGGKNYTGGYAPIDAALNPVLSPNRIAGMKADGITIEYSNDGGTTWSNYGLTNAQKISLVTTYQGVRIAGPSANCTNNSKLRITLDGVTGSVYTQIWKFHIYLSTNYSNDSKVTIESYDYNSRTTWNKIVENQDVSGWSGWNVINVSLPGSGAFGGTNNSQHQRKIRFTFSHNSITSGRETSGLTVYSIYAYGGVGWTTPSTLAARGVPYNYDYAGATTFMSSVTATTFKNSSGVEVSYNGHTHGQYITDGSTDDYNMLGDWDFNYVSVNGTEVSLNGHTHDYQPPIQVIDLR